MSGERARAGMAMRRLSSFFGGGYPDARLADGGDGSEVFGASGIGSHARDGRGFGTSSGRAGNDMSMDAALKLLDGAPHDASLTPRNVKVNTAPNNGVRLEWEPPTSVAALAEHAQRRCTYTIHILMPGQPQQIASTQQTKYIISGHGSLLAPFLFGVRTQHPTLGNSSIVFNMPDSANPPVIYHSSAVPNAPFANPGGHGGRLFGDAPPVQMQPQMQQLQMQHQAQLHAQQHAQQRTIFATQQQQQCFAAYAQQTAPMPQVMAPGASQGMTPPMVQQIGHRPPPPRPGAHGGQHAAGVGAPPPLGMYGAPLASPLGWFTASPASQLVAATGAAAPPPPLSLAPGAYAQHGQRPKAPGASAAHEAEGLDRQDTLGRPARTPDAAGATLSHSPLLPFGQPVARGSRGGVPIAPSAAAAVRLLNVVPPLSRVQTLRPDDAVRTLQLLRRTANDLAKCISPISAKGLGALASDALLTVPGQGVFRLAQALHAIMQALSSPAALKQHRAAFMHLAQHLALQCDRARFPRMEFLHSVLHSEPGTLAQVLGCLNALAFETSADVVVLQLVATFLQPRDTADIAGCRPLVKLYRQSQLFGEGVLLSLLKLKLPLTDDIQKVGIELIPFWDAALGTLPHDPADARLLSDVVGLAAANGCVPPLLTFLHVRLEAIGKSGSLAQVYMGAAPILRILGAVLKCDFAARVIASLHEGRAFVGMVVRLACEMLMAENSARDLLAAMLFELLALAALHPNLHSKIVDMLHVHLKRVLTHRQSLGGRPRPLLPRLTEALCCMHMAIVRGGRAPITTLLFACGGDTTLARALNDRLVALVISGNGACPDHGDATRALAFLTSFQLLEGNECGLIGDAQVSTAAYAELELDASECCRRQEVRVECSATSCGLGAKCTNRRLRHRAWAHVRQDEARLRVVEPVLEGELIIEAFGEIFPGSLDFANALKQSGVAWPPELCFLSLGGSASVALDVSRAGSLARLIAHSPTSPNCQFIAWLVDGQPRLGVFALCPVPAEAVLTADYSTAALGHPTRVIPTWWPQALTPQQSTTDVSRRVRVGSAVAAADRPSNAGRQDARAERAPQPAAPADAPELVEGAPDVLPAKALRQETLKRAFTVDAGRSIRARKQDWSAAEERALAAMTMLGRNVSNPLVAFRRVFAHGMTIAQRSAADADAAASARQGPRVLAHCPAVEHRPPDTLADGRRSR